MPASWGAAAAIGIGEFALETAEFLPVGLLPQIARGLSVSEGQAGLRVTIPGVLVAYAALLTIGLLSWGGDGFGMLPIVIQSWIFSAAPDRLESVAALFVSIANSPLERVH